jgi:hypothetical protein
MALFENWTEDHSSPMINEDSGGAILTSTYWAVWEDIWIGLPEIGSYYPGSLTRYDDLILSNFTIRNDEGGQRARIALVYKSKQRGGGARTGGSSQIVAGATVYSMDDGALEKTVASNDSYVTVWDHHLANKIGTSQSAPSLASTNTDIQAPGGATESEWAWVKDLSEKGTDWEVQSSNKRTKQGIDSYIISAPVVRARSYYENQSDANNAASPAGTIATPGNTFGKSGSWLVTGASVYYEDPFWVADVAYQSGIIDTDLYA